MVSSLEELRKRLTRKDLKVVIKIYKINLAEDRGKMVTNYIVFTNAAPVEIGFAHTTKESFITTSSVFRAVEGVVGSTQHFYQKRQIAPAPLLMYIY